MRDAFRPPEFDPNDPVKMTRWATWIETWVSDRFVWISNQLEHLHACIENKAVEAEELSESRHQQNIASMKVITGDLKDVLKFVANATNAELIQGAIVGERERVRTKRQELIARGVHYAFEVGKVLLAAGALTALSRLVGLP